MKNKILLTLALLYACSGLWGQTQLPGKCTAFYPDVLLRSMVLSEKDALGIANSRDFGQSRVASVQKHWIVFSDRDDNITYTEPNARSATFSKLSLNEEVRIAQIKDGFAQVYVEPQKSIEYPKISQYAECKGWIPMGKLLLWHSCPANNVGVYNKALLCVNLDDMGDGGKLYRNPSKKGGYTTLNTDMNFYFVMKRENGMALLSKFHTMEGTTNQVLYGWVGEASYVAWNQRSCLEPNWDEEAVGYFSKNKILAKVYDTKVHKPTDRPGTSWSYAEYASNVDAAGKDKGKYRYRMPANMLRFPILDGGNSTLYHCSSFGATGSAAGTSINRFISGEDTKIRKSKEAVEKLSRINIGIVIDGTKSMEPYFPAVRDAILEGVKFFTKNEKVRFGVVIYRDYTDGDGLLETFQMTTPNNPNLEKFLMSGGTYGVKSSKQDRTAAEALYYGIDSALDFFKFNPDESNIMLVVGDCGNDRADTKISSEAIVKKLVDKNVHFMGFQVRAESDDAYTLFTEQLLDIMKNSVQKKYDKMWAHMSEADKKGAKKLTVKPVLEEDGYTISNNYQNELFIGAYRNPDRKKAMDPAKLTSLMEKAIGACSQTVDYQRGLLVNSAAGGDVWGTAEAVTGQMLFDKEFVRSRLGDQVEDTDGKLLTFTGWTEKKTDDRELWKPVIFISSDEFTVLMTRLEPVNDAAVAKADNREPYINALKALIQSLVPDITDDEMNRKGYKEVMDLIAGLNESSQALKGRTIAEIASPHAVKQQEYMSMVNDFKRKFSALRRIQSSKYTYVRDFNGTKYYWIPIEDLP